MHVPSVDCFSTQRHEPTLLRSLTVGVRHVKAKEAESAPTFCLQKHRRSCCTRAASARSATLELLVRRRYDDYYDYDYDYDYYYYYYNYNYNY